LNPPVLPDVLAQGLRVVFCGTAAGTVSARAGHYYAKPGNQFWRTLHLVGLTPRLLAPSEFRKLPAWGIGLTDVCKVNHGMDRDIAAEDYDIEGLTKAMAEYRPGVLAFTSKEAAKAAFGLRSTRPLTYGQQVTRLGPLRQPGAFPRRAHGCYASNRADGRLLERSTGSERALKR
jgi:TDG/mug DNA glycosylase family protein